MYRFNSIGRYLLIMSMVLSCFAFQTVSIANVSAAASDIGIYQAEDAKFYLAATETKNSGYTGSSYVNYNNVLGGYIEWTVDITQAGAQTLTFTYANGTSSNRTLDIYVNGSVQSTNLELAGTGSWSTWKTQSATVMVNSGTNVIRATSTSTDGGPNVDKIEITGSTGIIVTPPPTPTPTLVTGDIYIAPDGNDNNAGTKNEPFFNLSKAVSVAGPGTKIYAMGGTYKYDKTVFLEKSGFPSAMIEILAYNNEKPVFDFSNFKPANKDERFYARGITILGSYWHLKGLEVCNSPDNGIKCEGAHNIIELCVFHHNGDAGLQIGLQKDTLSANPDPENLAAYNKVINCDAYRNADPATSYENADGFACKCYAGKGNYFYGCRAWENCDDGWDLYQTDYEVVIENCWTWHNGDPSIWGFTSFNGDGNGFKLGGNDTPCPVTIRNCVAFDSPYGAMCGFNDNNNGSAINVLNCTAWACGKDFKLQDQAHVLKNNIAFDPKSGKKFTRDLSSTAVSVNNTWDLTTLTPDYNDFISTSATDAAAPREADGSLPNNGFAKLKADSDLIDKGVEVGLPFNGNAPDLGAYEYGSSITIPSPTPTMISPTPTNTSMPGFVYGDLNGDGNFNSIDFALFRSYLLGLIVKFPVDDLGGNGFRAADVDSNNNVNSIDFALFRSKILGILKLFPAEGGTNLSTPASTPTTTPVVPVSNLVVAKDGSGDFTSVQAAIDSVPENNTDWFTIYIKNGTYKEVITVPESKTYIKLVGESAQGTILTYDNYNTLTGTTNSASVFIKAKDFIAKDITFENSFDYFNSSVSGKQAVACEPWNDRQIYLNCRFKGYQDTLFVRAGRQYFKDCYIEGVTDFIFGEGTAVFDECEIYSISKNSSSAMCAPSTLAETPYGLVFFNCHITGDPTIKPGYISLGRPWHPSSAKTPISSNITYLYCQMDALCGDWTDMGSAKWADDRFREYKNSGDGASTSSNRPQLTDSEAANYTTANILKGNDNWNPEAIVSSLE